MFGWINVWVNKWECKSVWVQESVSKWVINVIDYVSGIEKQKKGVSMSMSEKVKEYLN